jgi:HPt (histidine-containing phosphotransfer) domain-containing protein
LPPALPGIDTTVGLGFARGKPAFYLKLLKMFRDNQGMNFAKDFHTALAANDWTTAVRLAHTLKGLAGGLGANELARIAAALERAAGECQTERIAALEEDIGRELTHIMEGLARLDEVAAGARFETASVDPRKRQAAIDHFGQLLESRDTAAVAYLEEFKRVMAGVDGLSEPLAAISHSVSCYDYAAARRLLQRLTIHRDPPSENTQ